MSNIPERDMEPPEQRSLPCTCGGSAEEHPQGHDLDCPNELCMDGQVYDDTKANTNFASTSCEVCFGKGHLPYCTHCNTCTGYDPIDPHDDGDYAFDSARDDAMERRMGV